MNDALFILVHTLGPVTWCGPPPTSTLPQDFPRLKVGIGRPAGDRAVTEWVLKPFLPNERPEIELAVKEAAAVVEMVLDLGLDMAMSLQKPSKVPKSKGPG